MCRHGTTKFIKLNNKEVEVDTCIIPIIEALNNAGVRTTACCCGHKRTPGNVTLADGRVITIFDDFKTAKKAFKNFPNINGQHKKH